jgi:hypothetical protein
MSEHGEGDGLEGLSREECIAEIARLRRELVCQEAAAVASRHVVRQMTKERDAFRAAFDDCPLMQVWCDASGRVLRVNKAASAALGGMQAPPDMTVFNDPQLIMLGVPAYFERALAGEAVRMPRYSFNTSKTHLGAPDVDIVLETMLYPIFGPDGAVDSVVVQHFDMSVQDRAEKEAARLKAALDAKERPW